MPRWHQVRAFDVAVNCVWSKHQCAGDLYCVGGYSYERGRELASVERCCFIDDTWVKIAPMNQARRGLALAAFSGHLYATGAHFLTGGW